MLKFIKYLFCIYWDDHMIFIFHSINVVSHIYWDADGKPLFSISGMNFTWSWYVKSQINKIINEGRDITPDTTEIQMISNYSEQLYANILYSLEKNGCISIYMQPTMTERASLIAQLVKNLLAMQERPRFNSFVRKIFWRRDRLPTSVFWRGEFHGLYSPWSLKELNMTEQLSLHFTTMTESWRNRKLEQINNKIDSVIKDFPT